jgi:hypothetical protein
MLVVAAAGNRLNRSSRDRIPGPSPSNPPETWEEGGRCRQTIALRSPGVGVIEPDTRGRAATNASMGAIAGTVGDRTTRRPVSAATVRVKGTRLSALTRDDGRFRLSMVPVGARTLIVHASNYEPLVSEVRVSPRRTTTVLLKTERIQPVGRARDGSLTRIP